MNNKENLAIYIPDHIQVGGQDIKVEYVNYIEGGSMGECCTADGRLKIALEAKGYQTTKSTRLNTFIHECTHLILDNMGRIELSQDEQFVSTFAGFATEILRSIIRKSEGGEK